MAQSVREKGGSYLISASVRDDIFTPEDMTDEHHMIADTARKFVEKEVVPATDKIEEKNYSVVAQLMRKAGALGLLGDSIPEKYGGLGLDKISKGIVGEAVGATGSYGVAHSNHTCIATLPITYFGTLDQKKKYLPKLASGEYIGAYCLTEPEAGSDALSSKTTAVLDNEGSHYLLNGTKVFITNAEFSDTFIVYAKVDGEKFTAFLVEKDFPGLSLGAEENKMGIKGSSTRSVIFEDCKVPAENVIGEVGKGHVIALNVLNLGRFNLGSACTGGAKQGFEKTLSYTTERKQFGTAIADFPLSKEKIAKMAARIYAAESVQYRTSGLLESALGGLYDSDDHSLIAASMMEYATECSICKVFSSETLDYVADEAVQLHGGYGFIKEYDVERMYRDSRINRIFEGTNEVNRLLIPSTLFKKAAAGELDLEKAVQDAVNESRGEGTESGLRGPLEKELEAVRSIRRAFLICAGTVYRVFGQKLKHEQESLKNLADLAILLFAGESVVLRTKKAIETSGSEKEALKHDLALSFVADIQSDAEAVVRQLLTGVLSGEEARRTFKLIQDDLGRYFPEGGIDRNRRIADRMISAKKYKV